MNRKFTNDFDSLTVIKTELKNSNSKISKDGMCIVSNIILT